MKRIAFILLTNLLLVEGRTLSIWEDEKERKADLDERERRMPQVRIAFSLSLQIRLISIFFLSQQSFSRMIAFILLAMGMNNTHRKFLVVSTEEILCQSDRITNSVFSYTTTL